MTSTATISLCGDYRYDLTRTWDPSRLPATFVMLNPSKADAEENDPTILRCIGFAKRWGCGGLVVVNLFAYRSPHPGKLEIAVDPVGPENDATIAKWVSQSSRVIVAWGSAFERSRRPLLRARPVNVLAMLDRIGVRPQHLGLTKSGQPKHPLARGHHRIPDDFEPQTFPEFPAEV